MRFHRNFHLVDYFIITFLGLSLFFIFVIIFSIVNGYNPSIEYSSDEYNLINQIFNDTSKPFVAYFIPVLLCPYFIFLENSKWQGTVGKKIFNLLVVSETGSRISLKTSIFRTFGKLICGIMPPGGIVSYGACILISPIGYLTNLIMVLVTNSKQTLYDKIAKTYVVERQTMNRKSSSVIINSINSKNKINVDASVHDESKHYENSNFYNQKRAFPRSLLRKKVELKDE